jgi:DNA polymerase III epsilon subunit-like protein
MNKRVSMAIVPEPMDVALRCYSDCGKFALQPHAGMILRPSRWTLVLDTETHTDAAQGFRFGTYQVRNGNHLHESGIFYDPETATTEEIVLYQRMARRNSAVVWTLQEFIQNVFLKYSYDREGTVVGFNLPFDISRIAIHHSSARGEMRGGFSFVVSPFAWHPRIQIRHLNSRLALIRFTVPGKQRRGRGMRRRDLRVPPHRGHFVDLRTLAASLTSASHSLASLGKFLGIEHRKLETEQHGGPLTEDYTSYAIQDVQATWECYRKLIGRYQAHRLTDTPVHVIKSEAGMGKAYLRQMGILPWRQT